MKRSRNISYEDSDLIRSLSSKVKENMTMTGEQCSLIEAPKNMSILLFRQLIDNGFLPTSKGQSQAVESHKLWEDIYFDRYDDQTLLFWVGRSSKDIIQEIEEFEYCTIEGMRMKAVRNAESFGLLLFSPQDVYTQSRRPKTNMGMFRFADSVEYTTPPGDWFESDNNFLPVTRYAAGMRKSLYFEDTLSEQEYCGTFYYYEPESTTFLHFQQPFLAFNKKDAVEKLYNRASAKVRRKYLKVFQEQVEADFNEEINNDWEGKLHLGEEDIKLLVEQKDVSELLDLMFTRHLDIDPMFTPMEFANEFQNDPEYNKDDSSSEEDSHHEMEDWEQEELIENNLRNTRSEFKHVPPIEQASQLPDKPFYTAFTLRLYGQEDSLDQTLCDLAKKQGYDVVVLKKMIGSRQLVTEILDTRPREESFRNLYFPKS